MPQNLLLGIDIGTTGTKILLIDASNRIIGDVNKPATLYSPEGNWAEEDALEWWNNVLTGVPECLSKYGIHGTDIAAIGVSGMVPTTILVGENGEPLRRSIQQNDARSQDEIDHFKRSFNEDEIFHRTGSAITQQSIAPKLLWLSKHEPDAFKSARWIMGSYDFINFRLTGVPTLERNWALESGMYDLHQETWVKEILSAAGIREEQLPSVHLPTDVVGGVLPEVAAILGVPAGTPVVAGSADHVASAFSVGVRDNGDLLVKLGGAGDILYSMDRPEINKALFLDYHVIPGLYLINGCMASSGSIIKWFRNEFGSGLDYPELDSAAMSIPAGSDGLVLLPYFLGEKTPIFDTYARGMFFGLSLQHTRAHLYHAILEGISYGFLHHIKVLQAAGFNIKRVRVANGGARSRLWRQVTADVIGYPLEEVDNHPGSSLGAAFIAGKGVGLFRQWDEIEGFIQLKPTTQPNEQNHRLYQEYFKFYRELYESNRENFIRLGGIRDKASGLGGQQ